MPETETDGRAVRVAYDQDQGQRQRRQHCQGNHAQPEPQAWRQGRTLNLTPTTHKLLMCLVRAAPAVVRKQEMEYLIWGDEPPESGALRTHIHELRLQEDRPFNPALSATVHSVGWRLDRPALAPAE